MTGRRILRLFLKINFEKCFEKVLKGKMGEKHPLFLKNIEAKTLSVFVKIF